MTISDLHQPTELEKQAIREFMAEHRKCADTRPGFSPADAVAARASAATLPQCGPFGSEKAEPHSLLHPHGHCEYTGPYGETLEVDTVSCAHCLAGDTKILTSNGVRDISAIEVGEQIVDNSGCLTTVRAVHKRTVPAFHRIQMRGGGEPLLISDEHPLWALHAHYEPRTWRRKGEAGGSDCWKPSRYQVDTEPAFVPAASVTPGMWLALPSLSGEVEPEDFCGTTFDENLARFIGLFLAEGCLGRDRIEFGFHKKEVEYIEFVRSFAKERWGANNYCEDRASSQTFKVTIHSCRLEQAFWKTFGRRAANKKMPFSFMLYPRAIQEAMMRGLLEGDGCKPKRRPCRQLSTVSPHLAYQSAMVLRRLGSHPSINSRPAYVDAKGVNHQREYKVTFSDKARARQKKGMKRHFAHDGYTWVKVMRNDRVEAALPVFNLTTDSETFMANGFATHNCRRHIEYRTGIDKQLGFCALCYNGRTGSGTTCGHPDCLAHVPFEQRLENWEAGRPTLTPASPRASVPELKIGTSHDD